MGFDEIKNDRDLINSIDWDMTPEEAVRLYLEWGNNWTRGYHMVRSKDDFTYYFVLNTWESEPVIYFVKRNSEEAKEIAKIEIPEKIKEKLLEGKTIKKGIYSVEGEVRDWLKKELNA